MPENKDIERRKPDEIERRSGTLVQRSLDYLKEFEEQGLTNIEEPDIDGWSLHHAAEKNRVGIARALIARGDDVNAVMKPKPRKPRQWIVCYPHGTRHMERLHEAAEDAAKAFDDDRLMWMVSLVRQVKT